MAGEIIYSVFVSSTYEDLREERAAVQKALLQLHCMPIGMELFGSADEETWDFIKRQIEDCDYYVVIVADKYGSTAEDGVSYTEKEYDYAREIKKPVLAFVHNDRESIPRNKTERNPEKRPKLEAFIQKVRKSPVSFFTAPHDLATQVTVSFVNFRERRPAVGFIRADRVPDLKRYAEILEENARLRDEISLLRTSLVVFENGSDIITLEAKAKTNDGYKVLKTSMPMGNLFVIIARSILRGCGDDERLPIAVRVQVFGQSRRNTVDWPNPEDLSQIMFILVGKGLVDIEHRMIEEEEPNYRMAKFILTGKVKKKRRRCKCNAGSGN